MMLSQVAEAQSVQVIRMEFTDAQAISQLGKVRDLQEYHPLSINKHHFLSPANTSRSLLRADSLANLQKTAQAYHIEDAHIRIIKHALPSLHVEYQDVCFVPFHITIAFRYRGLNIVGQLFMSILHAIKEEVPENMQHTAWAAHLQEMSAPLSQKKRQELIEYYMRDYLSGTSVTTDVTILAIPLRTEHSRRASPTHLALASLAIPHPDTHEKVISRGKYDVYLFAHNNQADAQAQGLMRDAQFLTQSGALRDAWTANAIAHNPVEEQIPPHNLLYKQQLYMVLNWIRTAWRTAASYQEHSL